MFHSAPGKSHRDSIGVIEPAEMFPDEAAAVHGFEQPTWPHGRMCGH